MFRRVRCAEETCIGQPGDSKKHTRVVELNCELAACTVTVGPHRSRNGILVPERRDPTIFQSQAPRPLFTEPSSPRENGFAESFHASLRDECLNEEIFYSGGECQVLVDWWREVYNRQRPHSSLGFKTPAEVAEEYLTGQQN